jgi:uncharacterized phage protein gp47/JayE
MTYRCCDQHRRALVAAHPTLNGIDYLEVLDREAPAGSPRQRTLFLRLLKSVPAGLGAENVRIDGGERVRNVRVEWAAPAAAPPPQATAAEAALFSALADADQVLVIRVDQAGDFSPYQLRLVRSATDGDAPAGFDTRLVDLQFSFKVECPSDFDCAPANDCVPESDTAPDIDYLAKDYPSFRRLILDRLTRLSPAFQERSPADIGVTLAELVAYAADQLSYFQDAVATEAYLETARRRTSLRRHALLVDYRLHDGCNARAWLALTVSGSGVPLTKDGVRFYTRLPGTGTRLVADSPEDRRALSFRPTVFEPMHEATLHEAHNELHFHTWSDARCCLPEGAIRATLRGHLPDLSPGDVLLFEEQKGPLSGEPADADRTHRHVVRLTSVQAFAGGSPLTDPLDATPITEIAWALEDALPFPLCISSITDADHGETPVLDVSVARGNLVLVDHGRRLPHPESFPPVPRARAMYPRQKGVDRCAPAVAKPVLPRYRPELAEGPLTRVGTVIRRVTAHGVTRSERVAFDPTAPAARAFGFRVDGALPAIRLSSQLGSDVRDWSARSDLLNSEADATDFVVETEHDGRTTLRFGDDHYGRRPEADTRFTADYRIGNGGAGNIGAEMLSHVVGADSRITSVRNPMPARGGVDPESAAEVRRRAPQAFRRQERAVTRADYAEVTERLDSVQRAAATPRWTGSWHTFFVTVDRRGGESIQHDGFRDQLAAHVDRYRLAAQDVAFNDPVYVSLELDLLVCVRPEYFRSHVRAALLEVLSSRRLADGGQGLFHPDRFSFGQPVYLSPVYAAARAVAGVSSLEVTRFERQGIPSAEHLSLGYLKLGRLEVARLENNPNFPEHGVLRLTLFGGK